MYVRVRSIHTISSFSAKNENKYLLNFTNQKVIFEVLSSTTEKFDRYDFWNPTLSDYLLVSQEQPRIEHYIRQTDGTWTRAVYRGLKSKIVIKSIGCALKLADVYDRIQFAAS